MHICVFYTISFYFYAFCCSFSLYMEIGNVKRGCLFTAPFTSYTSAIISTSHKTFFGSVFTATQLRAGFEVK